MTHLLIIVRLIRELKAAKEQFQSIDPQIRPHFYAANGDVRDLSGLQFSAVIGMEHLDNAYDRAFVQLRLRKPL